MTQPYYSGPGGKIYLGDAREILPTLARNSVDLIVTDPPYGVNWQSNRRLTKFDKISGDNGDLDVISTLALALPALKVHRHIYVFGYTPDELSEPLHLGGTTELIWDKMNMGMGDLSLPWGPSHERITFGVYVPSKSGRNRGDGKLSARLRKGSVLRALRPNATAVTKHSTEKPVALMRMLVESSSVIGDVVLDPFMGAGSTIVAAALLGRQGVGIEIDEQYCKLAASRLQIAEQIALSMEKV